MQKQIIFLIGPSYCGKSYFASTVLKALGLPTISMGDLFRAYKENLNGIQVSDEVFNKFLKSYDFFFALETTNSNIIVIDNAFKSVYQAKEMFARFYDCKISIIRIFDERTSVDFTTRKRSDDTNIKAKIALYEQNIGDILLWINENYPEVEIQNVYNRDSGFVFEKGTV